MTDSNIYLKLLDCCQAGNRIYFLSITFNGLFYLDIEDLSIHFVHSFSFESKNMQVLTELSLYHNNALYFFPNSTNVIMKYDILKQQEESIAVKGYHWKFFATAAIIRRNHLVYIFSAHLQNGIYVFDLQNQTVEKDERLSLLFEDDYVCSNAFLIDDHCAMISIFGTNRIVEVDLDTKQISAVRTINADIDIYSVCYDGDRYWILSESSTDIYEWDRENDTLQVYKNENAIWEEPADRPYSTMIFLDDETLVLNGSLKNILRVDKKKKTIGDPIAMPQGYRLVDDNLNHLNIYNCYTVLEEKVFIYPCRGNMLLIYDKKTRSMFGKEFSVPETEVSYLKDILQEDFMGEKICTENGNLDTLDRFLEIVETKQSAERFSTAENVGQLIFEQIIH